MEGREKSGSFSPPLGVPELHLFHVITSYQTVPCFVGTSLHSLVQRVSMQIQLLAGLRSQTHTTSSFCSSSRDVITSRFMNFCHLSEFQLSPHLCNLFFEFLKQDYISDCTQLIHQVSKVPVHSCFSNVFFFFAVLFCLSNKVSIMFTKCFLLLSCSM